MVEGRVRPAPSLLLTTAAAEARTVGDPAGNHKLAKATQGGRQHRARDDNIVAAILTIAVGAWQPMERPRRWRNRRVV